MIRHAPILLLLAAAPLAIAQTPIQETGSVQAAPSAELSVPVAPTTGPSVSVSVEGLSNSGTLNSTAPDSGPQPWKDVMGWITLAEGMSPDEVRALLGPDYRESTNSKGVVWTYQDQKALLFGSVSFVENRLATWNSPRF